MSSNTSLNGINPLSYLGVNSATPPNFLIKNGAPTQNDLAPIGTFWLDYSTNTPPSTTDLYICTSVAQSIGTWVAFSAGSSVLRKLTGNSGGAITPDTSSNINILGGTNVSVAGDLGSNTLTINASGSGGTVNLVGTSGGAVSPDGSGNITLSTEQTWVSIVGDAGTHSLSINTPVVFTDNAALSVLPNSSGVTSMLGSHGITVTGTPGSHLLTWSSDAARTITPTSGEVVSGDSTNGNINFVAGTNMSITGVAATNTLTFSSTGGTFNWNVISGSTQTAVAGNGYITTNAGLVTFTLPVVGVVGDIIKITCSNDTGSWIVSQSGGQKIYFGGASTTTGVTGSLASSGTRENVELLCINAPSTWTVQSALGNLTYV